jgi:hypothetical protein
MNPQQAGLLGGEPMRLLLLLHVLSLLLDLRMLPPPTTMSVMLTPNSPPCRVTQLLPVAACTPHHHARCHTSFLWEPGWSSPPSSTHQLVAATATRSLLQGRQVASAHGCYAWRALGTRGLPALAAATATAEAT